MRSVCGIVAAFFRAPPPAEGDAEAAGPAVSATFVQPAQTTAAATSISIP
jgi:hypothetical protein